MNWRHAAREPLVHFLLGGLAIFALFAWRGEPADPASRTIRLTREDQAQIALSFEQMMARPPTRAELDGLIDRWIHDEVLYREALRLGLDQDDPVIRRRLGQKMDVITASAADAEQPDEATLQRWLANHPNRFAGDAKLSLDQLYFGSEAAASAAKTRLAVASDWRELGQAVALPQSLTATPRTEIADQFGEAFVRAVDAIDADGNWHGPVGTALGWHLLRLRKRESAALPKLADIRQRVEDDWRTDTERARKDAGYALLRGAYTVEIDR